MSLHYFVKLKSSLSTCYHWVVTERNSRICLTSTVASKFVRFESRWSQRVENTAREGVQSMHHWSRRTETATENGVDQAGSCDLAAGTATVLASSSSRSVMRVLYTFSCNISHTLLSTGLKSGKFGGHS